MVLSTYRDGDDLEGHPRRRTDAAPARRRSRDPSTTMGDVHEAESREHRREEGFSPQLASSRLTKGPPLGGKPTEIIQQKWRPQRDSNPRNSLERAGSWAGLDDGDQ